MAHEGDHALGGLRLVEGVELLSHLGDILLGILEEGHTELQHDTREVVVVEIAVAVVGEVLNIIDHARIFFTGNDLQRLHDNLVVAHTFLSESVEPEVRRIEVAGVDVLAGCSTVDADSR